MGHKKNKYVAQTVLQSENRYQHSKHLHQFTMPSICSYLSVGPTFEEADMPPHSFCFSYPICWLSGLRFFVDILSLFKGMLGGYLKISLQTLLPHPYLVTSVASQLTSRYAPKCCYLSNPRTNQ